MGLARELLAVSAGCTTSTGKARVFRFAEQQARLWQELREIATAVRRRQCP